MSTAEPVDFGTDRSAVIAEVQSMWHEWMRQRDKEAYDPMAAAYHRAHGTMDEETGQMQSDYEEHAYIVSASREDWLAYMAMLAARGIEVEVGGGLMITALVASNPVTQIPIYAFMSDGRAGRIVDAKGEVAGSAAAIKRIKALYDRAEVPLSIAEAFALWSTAHGNLVLSDPVSAGADFSTAATAMMNQLAAAAKAPSADRQGRLDQVRRTRDMLLMDEPAAFQPGTEGLDEEWRPAAAAEFYSAAATPPIPYTEAEQAERVAFLQQWLAAQVPDEGDAEEAVDGE